MSKAVMISVQPKWCELIARGTKTVEVRKTRPKLETPFKCYIYCTKPNTIDPHEYLETHAPDGHIYHANGKVMGEFVCDTYVVDKTYGHDPLFNGAACMSEVDAAWYCVNKEMYGWHISDLVIYDKPKELSEFHKPCIYGNDDEHCWCFECDKSGYTPDMHIDCFNVLTRPPQSWCYVEEQT